MITHGTCRYCLETKDVSEMKKGSITWSTGKGSCKKCCNDYNKIYNAVKRAEANPEKYSECDGCDRYFSTFGIQGKPMDEPLGRCPHCGSLEVRRMKL